jgi:hypothetical protein
MTQTVKQFDYAEFYRNFRRFERGELPLRDVERLSLKDAAAPVNARSFMRWLLFRFHYPTLGEYYRGTWKP